MSRDASRRALTTFEWGALALILAGLLLRLLGLDRQAPDYDAKWYVAMGEGLVRYREFYAPWAGAFTQHYPPAYPAFLAAFFAAFGATYFVAWAANFAIAAFLVGVALFTTWDLYGRARGFAVAAVVACLPILVKFDVTLLSESMVVAFFALTIWGILKSLDNPRFILAAGLFAGLGYLTKASMGPFFLLAAAGGFAWRFYYVRWRVFADKHYMAAGAIFLAFVLPWAYRNARLFGWTHWETQPHATDAVKFLFTQAPWPRLLAGELAWTALIVLILALPFLPEVWRTRKAIRDERTSALWLAVVTPSLVAVVFTAAFWAFEQRDGLLQISNFRYLVTPLIPLLWLGMRDLDVDAPRPRGAPTAGASLVRRHRLMIAAGVAVLAFFLATDPAHPFTSTVRLWILYVGIGAGLALLLLARASEWRPATRQEKDGATTWRAVPNERRGSYPALAVGVFATGIVASLYIAHQIFPYFAVGAAALLVHDARLRVLALCIVLASVSLAYYEPRDPGVRIADDLNAIAPPGALVTLTRDHEQDVWPYLRTDLNVADDRVPGDLIVDDNPHVFAPRPPSGYETVRTYSIEYAIGPGTRAGLAIWGTLLDDQAPAPNVPVGFLYHRANATPTGL